MSSVWPAAALPVPARQMDMKTEAPIHGQVIRTRCSWKVEKGKLGTALMYCPTSNRVTLNSVKCTSTKGLEVNRIFLPYLNVYLN